MQLLLEIPSHKLIMLMSEYVLKPHPPIDFSIHLLHLCTYMSVAAVRWQIHSPACLFLSIPAQ